MDSHDGAPTAGNPTIRTCRCGVVTGGATAQDPDGGAVLINVLGPLEAIVAGVPVEVTGRTKRAVLALLALRANEPIPVAELVGRVWESDPPANASSIIRAAAGELRAQCGDRSGVRVTVAEAYLQLTAAPQAVDLLVSRRLAIAARVAAHAGRPGQAADLLRCALDLWHGHPLGGHGPVAADPAWPEAAELVEEHWALLEDRLDADCAAGRYGVVIDELQQLVAASRCGSDWPASSCRRCWPPAGPARRRPCTTRSARYLESAGGSIPARNCRRCAAPLRCRRHGRRMSYCRRRACSRSGCRCPRR